MIRVFITHILGSAKIKCERAGLNARGLACVRGEDAAEELVELGGGGPGDQAAVFHVEGVAADAQGEA